MLNLLFDYDISIESFTYPVLLCPLFISKRCTLISNLNKVDPKISKFNLSNLRNTLLFGEPSFTDKINTLEYAVSNANISNIM